MPAIARIVASVALVASPSLPPRVLVLSPAPEVSAVIVRPFLDVRRLADEGDVEAGSVIWVAGECQRLDFAVSERLARLAAAGAVVVVEDAPRIATGPLGAALGLPAHGSAVRPGTSSVRCLRPQHPATIGIPVTTWRVPAQAPRPTVPQGDIILATDDGFPVLWVRRSGRGKVVGVAAARRSWASPACAIGYDMMLAQLLAAAARAPTSYLAELSARAAFRAWMYLGFPVGQAVYLLHEPVPAEYRTARELAEKARAVAATRPAEALALAARAAAVCARLQDLGRRIRSRLPLEPERKASERRGLVLCPGTLDFLHSMNMSSGGSGPGVGRPSSGRELWPDDLADNPPGPATACWRGLRPFLVLTAELPVNVNPALCQKSADGSILSSPSWLTAAVGGLLRASVPDVRAGTFVFYSRGQPWLTGSCEPGGDYSPEAVSLFAELARKSGVPAEAAASPPASWQPTAAWSVWQQVRAQAARNRWRTLAEAVHARSPSAILAVDAGYLCDPLHAGVGPETGAEYLDCLAPVVLANYGPGFDPADLVAAIRLLASVMDSDGDGAADRWPGVVARFLWQDVLALPPAAHELTAAIALACGARGIMQTVAHAPDMADAAAVVPEDVYVRWEGSFAPAIWAQTSWLRATPVCDALVWQSFSAAAMARPSDAAERIAALRSAYWAGVIARLGYVPAYVSDAELRAGRFGGARVLVVPSVLCVGDELAAAVEKFARAGGTVMLGPGSFAFDGYHRPPPKPLAWLEGFSQRLASPTDSVVEQVRKGCLAAPSVRPTRRAHVAGGGGGAGAAWWWEVGEGRVVYCRQEPAGTSALASLARILAAGDPERREESSPRVVASPPVRGILLRSGKDSFLLLAYNAGPVGKQSAIESARVRVHVGPGPWSVRWMQPQDSFPRSRFVLKAVRAKAAGEEVRFVVSLPPYGYRLYVLSRA